MAALREQQGLLTAIAGLAAGVRELQITRDVEATVQSAMKAKLLEAIQARSAVIQENIMQSMTVELHGRIAERTAHFATRASVDRRVAAGQAELISIKD